MFKKYFKFFGGVHPQYQFVKPCTVLRLAVCVLTILGGSNISLAGDTDDDDVGYGSAPQGDARKRVQTRTGLDENNIKAKRKRSIDGEVKHLAELASRYETGVDGQPQDKEKALQLYKKAYALLKKQKEKKDLSPIMENSGKKQVSRTNAAFAADTGGSKSSPTFSQKDNSSSGKNSKSVKKTYYIENFLRLGPIDRPLNQGDDSVVTVDEPASTAPKTKRKSEFFKAARKHHVHSILTVGNLHQIKGNYLEAFSYYLLGIGCHYAKTLLINDTALECLKTLAQQIEGSCPEKKKRSKKDKKLLRDIKQLRAKNWSYFPQTTPDFDTSYRKILCTSHFLATFVREYCGHYEFYAFMQLASEDSDSLIYFSQDIRYLKGVYQDDEPLLFKLEKRFLRRLNQKNGYYMAGERYLLLGRDKTAEKKSPDRHLTEKECFDRAAELFRISQHRDALHLLRKMYQAKKVGGELSTAARLAIMKDLYTREGWRELYQPLSKAYLDAAIELRHDRNGTGRDASDMEVLYFKEAEDLLLNADGDNQNNLGYLYTEAGDYEKAKSMFLQSGSGFALANLANLYLEGRLGSNLRFELAAKYLQEAIDSHDETPVCLFNLALLYSSKHSIGSKLSQKQRLTKAITLYQRASKIKGVFKDGHALRMITLNYILLQDYDKAETYALKVVALGLPMDDVLAILNQLQRESSSSSDEEEPVKAPPGSGASRPNETAVTTVVAAASAPDVSPSNGGAAALSIDASLKRSFTADQVQVYKRSSRADKKHAQMLRNRAKVQAMIDKEGFKSSFQKPVKKGWSHSNALELLNETDDRTRIRRLGTLFSAILRNPGGKEGPGSPEELVNKKAKRAGITIYSRRITQEHRLTYVLNFETQEVHYLTSIEHYAGLDKALGRYMNKRSSIL